MFERNPIENAKQLQSANVQLVLEDGRTLQGRMALSITRSFADALNSNEMFIDFETFDGERAFIAKASIKSVKMLDIPAARVLPRSNENFDPHAILGVSRDADAETLRFAFVQKSKVYHPDRFAHVELPAEVADYLQAAARRVNMAYEMLQASQPVVRSVRSVPVWESRPAG